MENHWVLLNWKRLCAKAWLPVPAHVPWAGLWLQVELTFPQVLWMEWVYHISSVVSMLLPLHLHDLQAITVGERRVRKLKRIQQASCHLSAEQDGSSTAWQAGWIDQGPTWRVMKGAPAQREYHTVTMTYCCLTQQLWEKEKPESHKLNQLLYQYLKEH